LVGEGFASRLGWLSSPLGLFDVKIGPRHKTLDATIELFEPLNEFVVAVVEQGIVSIASDEREIIARVDNASIDSVIETLV
jgi:hypothetical protein